MERYLPLIATWLLLVFAAHGQETVRSETIKLHYIGPYYLTDTMINYNYGIEQMTITLPENSVTVTGNEKGIRQFKDYLAILDVEPKVYRVRMRLARFHQDADGKQTEMVVMSSSLSVLATPSGVPQTATEITDPSGYFLSIALRQNTDKTVTITSAIRELGGEGEIVSSGKNRRGVAVGETVRAVGMTEEKDKVLRRAVHRGEILKEYGEYSGYYLDVKLESHAGPAIAQIVDRAPLLATKNGTNVKAETIRLRHIGPYVAFEVLKSRRDIEKLTLDFRNNRVIVRGEEQAIRDARAAVRQADVPRSYYFVRLRLVRYQADASGRHTETTVLSVNVNAYNNHPASYPGIYSKRTNAYTVEVTICPNPDKTLTLNSEVRELDDEDEIVSSGKNTRAVKLWKSVRAVGMTEVKDARIRKAVHQGEIRSDLGTYNGYYLDVKVEPSPAPGGWP